MPTFSGSSPGRRPRTLRLDIQGLRAVAVMAVVFYHLSPHRLPGGYVGVDIFFVISGYLITSHLLTTRLRSVRDLTGFWARRVRRLLPAALLVLACTFVAVVALTPNVTWVANARHIIASTLYFENWRLANDSVDYLTEGAAPTAVQHFWSLAVEEQFYLVWPLLIMVVAFAARRLGWRVPLAVGVAIAAVAASSFAYSVWETAADPAFAYFSTPVRMWELAAGGLLAVVVTSSVDVTSFMDVPSSAHVTSGAPKWSGRLLASIIGLAGLGAIAASCWLYTAATPFPGWAAALPVGGAVAVIAAGTLSGSGAAGRVLGIAPLPFIGDISYSIYLWHWPLIVLLPYVSGHLGPVDKVAIVVASIALATLTRWLIENPFRRPDTTWFGRMPFRFALVGMLALSGAGTIMIKYMDREVLHQENALARSLATFSPCFGGGAMAEGPLVCPPQNTDPVPSPAAAQVDASQLTVDNCFEPIPFTGTRTCSYGDPNAPVSIALVGNSHAGQWFAALQPLMAKYHFRITTYVAWACNLNTQPTDWSPPSDGDACLAWGKRVMAATTSGAYDVVVTSSIQTHWPTAAHGVSADQARLARKGYTDEIERWTAAKVGVLVIRDTPDSAPIGPIPACVAAHPQTMTVCNGSRAAWISDDVLTDAAAKLAGRDVTIADLTGEFCNATTCYGVVGGVIVYSDTNHMTKTFATSLAPFVAPSLVTAIDHAVPKA
jgi:peptidoglycan/LPS O-acetylase OafA/YrhL